jgi:hypothetical protein
MFSALLTCKTLPDGSRDIAADDDEVAGKTLRTARDVFQAVLKAQALIDKDMCRRVQTSAQVSKTCVLPTRRWNI